MRHHAPSPVARCQSPIFIIGTERSGSNLLRLVLDSHSQIAIPHPPHFMRYFAPIAASYGDLTREPNRRALVRDVLRLQRTHIHPWEVSIDEDQVVSSASPSLFGVVAAVYEQYRIGAGKPRWGCKSTFMVDHVDQALDEYPAGRFVWLVRDPRDVAASARRSVFSHFHPHLTALLWQEQQVRAAAAQDAHGPARVHLLRYEDFVSRPREEVERLCRFLDVPLEPAMLTHDRSASARQTASLSESWQNASRPVNASSVGRHAHGLSPEERAMVELAAGAMMTRLGYSIAAPAAFPAVPSMLRVRALDLMMRLQVEWRSLRHDVNHWRRWSRDATVRWLQVKARAAR